jgi:hypothetical protein
MQAVNGDQRWWDGYSWRTGIVPALISTVTAQPSGTQATWSGARAFDTAAITSGAYYPSPMTAWTTGQWAQLGNGDHQRWQGNRWLSVGNGYQPDRMGGAPAVLPFSLADIRARNCTGYGTWVAGDKFTPADGFACYWTGSAWAKGYGPTRTNLIIDYLHDEGSGELTKDWGPNNSSAWLGGTGNPEASNPTWATYGLYFNGDVPGGNWNAATSADSLWLTEVTALVVLYLNGASRYHAFLHKHAGDGGRDNPFEFRTSNEGTNRLVFEQSHPTGIVGWTGPYVAEQTWVVLGVSKGHIAAAPTFYVNKVAITGNYLYGSADAITSGSNSPLYIGRRPDGVCTLNGAMGVVRVWNRILSQAEIDANYDAIRLTMLQRGVTLP